MRKWFLFFDNNKLREKKLYWKHKNSNLNSISHMDHNWSELNWIASGVPVELRHAIDIVKNILEWIDELPTNKTLFFKFQIENASKYSVFCLQWSRHGRKKHKFLNAYKPTKRYIEWHARVQSHWTVSCLSWSVCPSKRRDIIRARPFQMQLFGVMCCDAQST